jgi:acetyl esterase/lipase
MNCLRHPILIKKAAWLSALGALLLALSGCTPTPAGNVLAYLVAQQTGAQPIRPVDTGALAGRVTDPQHAPIAGATVVVALATGEPFTAVTGQDGRYRIDGVHVGHYVPAAVAPGYNEGQLTGMLGWPALAEIKAGATTEAPDLILAPYQPPPLPAQPALAAGLAISATRTVTATFPAGAQAEETRFTFVHNGLAIDALRLYLPVDAALRQEAAARPVLFAVYPTGLDDWSEASVGLAAQGYAVLALAPAARGLDIEAHADDARLVLAMLRSGAFGPAVSTQPVVALGGSFSSAVLARLVRAAPDDIAGWVTVGGIGNAFSGAADFYSGRTVVPPEYALAIPALGPANLFPLPFLRYSPVYSAGSLPPTLIIHTEADAILRLEQAEQLAAAARAAGVDVETFYYADVSHYLGIGANMTDEGEEMFYRILQFVERVKA